MRIAHFDCASGISGNMVLGALIDLGYGADQLRADVDRLGVGDIQIHVERGDRNGISGVHVRVETAEEHPHRHYADIRRILEAARLPEAVHAIASNTFHRIAVAEGKIHGIPPDQVHFHEVGAVDAMVDIVGAAFGFVTLGCEYVSCSPLHLGTGFVDCAHGRLPVPSPATLEILRGAPVYAGDVRSELVTPTGAALIRSIAKRFGSWPEMIVESIGYGLGTRTLPIPNVLRVALGTANPHTIEQADQWAKRREIASLHTHIGHADDGHSHHHEGGHTHHGGHPHSHGEHHHPSDRGHEA